MRIAVVHSFYQSNSPSGENQVVLAQVDKLRAAGHEVLEIFLTTDDEMKKPLYPLRAALRSSGVGGPSPLEAIVGFRADVVHVHNTFPNWSTGWMATCPAPIVGTLHNHRQVCAAGTLWRDGSDCTDCLTNTSLCAVKHKCYRGSAVKTVPLAYATRNQGKHSALLTHSDAIVTLNKNAQNLYEKLIPEQSVFMVPNFAPEQAAPIEDAHHGVLYIGRITEEKGVRWLAEHWSELETLDIVGDGPLKTLIGISKSNNVHMHGSLNHHDARTAIASALVMVIPSLWSEGVPTVALEALQSGTPLLISDACASGPTLCDMGAGEIFRSHNYADLKLKLRKILDNRQKYSRNARHLSATRFSSDAWLDSIQHAYSTAITSHKKRL